ncbi:DNA-directed RNA polymerase II core subunit rpo21 [Gurleya vavrai]
MKSLSEISLVGYRNIKKVFLVENEDKKYILQTEGVNLRDLLSNEKVRGNTLYSNDIIEVYSVLGIEAAREVILRELRSVIENEGYVNYRHLSLLSDVMTVCGYLTGITRHGVNRGEKSALMRCSFEETVEILLEAALIGEKSKSKEVTDAIILGQIVPIGTGCTELYLDISMLKDVVPLAQRIVFDFEKGEFGTPQIFSPTSEEIGFSPVSGNWSPTGGYSPKNVFSPRAYSPGIPTYNATSPRFESSFMHSNVYSPKNAFSPSLSYMPTSPGHKTNFSSYKPTSPSYAPSSPRYSAMSPGFKAFFENKKKDEKKD